MRVPAAKDIIQETEGNLEIPEIRVWCHPHKVGKEGEDYYETFDTFQEALDFIQESDEAEEYPLLAFQGYELNLYAMKPET